MFEGDAARLSRFDWMSIATAHLQGEPDLYSLQQAIRGVGTGLRMLSEELAALLQERTIPTQHSNITILDYREGAPGVNVALTATTFGSVWGPTRLRNPAGYANTANSTINVVNGAGAVIEGPLVLLPGNMIQVKEGGAAQNLVALGGFGAGIRFTNMFGAVRYAKAITAGAADATTAHVLTGSGSWVSYVDCNIVTDQTGATVATNAIGTTQTVRVYLPRTSGQDPNVRADDIIAFSWDVNGRAVCVSDVLDGMVGELRQLLSATPGDYASGLRGWFICDGSNSTQDMRGRVTYGYNSANTAFDVIGETVALTFAAVILGPDHNIDIGIFNVAGPVSTTTVGIAVNTSFPATGVDTTTSYVTSLASSGDHAHTISQSAMNAAFDWTLPADSMDGEMTIDTPTSLLPAGRVTLMIQRMN